MGTGPEGSDDHFGNAFAYDQGKLIVGAYQEGNISPLPGGKAYWFDLALSVPKQNAKRVAIYPNPASETIFIKSDFDSVPEKPELYSIKAALLKTVSGNPDRMPIGEISNGI